MPYFIEFLIDNWFIVIPLIFSLFALFLLDKISKAINLEPHKAVVLINKKDAVIIDIRSKKDFDEGRISQSVNVGPDLAASLFFPLVAFKAAFIIVPSKIGVALFNM